MGYVTTNVRLDPDDYRDLQTEARALGISLAEALRRALREHTRRWRGQAREEPAIYRAEPDRAAKGTGVTPGLAAARVRGEELVLPAPPGLVPDLPVLVSIVGSVTEEEAAALARHKAALDAMADDLERVPDRGAALQSEDDREIYR